MPSTTAPPAPPFPRFWRGATSWRVPRRAPARPWVSSYPPLKPSQGKPLGRAEAGPGEGRAGAGQGERCVQPRAGAAVAARWPVAGGRAAAAATACCAGAPAAGRAVPAPRAHPTPLRPAPAGRPPTLVAASRCWCCRPPGSWHRRQALHVGGTGRAAKAVPGDGCAGRGSAAQHGIRCRASSAASVAWPALMHLSLVQGRHQLRSRTCFTVLGRLSCRTGELPRQPEQPGCHAMQAPGPPPNRPVPAVPAVLAPCRSTRRRWRC